MDYQEQAEQCFAVMKADSEKAVPFDQVLFWMTLSKLCQEEALRLHKQFA